MNSVASVTMKEGSPVRTTAYPFRKPITRQSANVAAMAGHTGQPKWVVKSMIDIPAAPTIDPIERSNSPPIIRSATPTDRIPRGAAAFRYAAVPSRLRNGAPAVTAKTAQTRTTPVAAAHSGRASKRFSGAPAPRGS